MTNSRTAENSVETLKYENLIGSMKLKNLYGRSSKKYKIVAQKS